MRLRRRALGFSLLELVVVVIAVAILMSVALDRLLPLVGRAQRAAFLQVQRELQSALMLEAAERITRGESATLPELAAANPMTLLLSPPDNYVGALTEPRPEDVPPASWYFDGASKTLAYRVGKHTRFVAKDGPERLIELRVAFVFDDRDADGVYDAARDDLGGLRLEPVHAYDWPD